MPTRTLPIASLRPAPYNPRVPLQPGDPAWTRLERSLREFTLVQPLIWNERTGHIVGGHQRLEVLKHLGHTEVECIVVDLSLEREQALNITLNNPHVGSDFDPQLLNRLIEDLQSLSNFDATLTGFDESQLREFVLAPAPLPPEPPPATRSTIRITFEVPPADWQTVRPALDSFLATHHLPPPIELPP